MRVKIKNIALVLGALSAMGALTGLSACSDNLKPASQSVNNLSYDPNATNYQPVPSQSSLPAPVIAQISADSIPGQKMPMPTSNQNTQVNTVNVDLPNNTGSNNTGSNNSGLISARATAPASTSTGSAAAPVAAPVQTPQELVSAMNQAAVQNPEPTDFFNAMMTYDYTPGAVYTILCAPLNLTDIVLEPGEKIISIAAGDTLRWQITQTYSGSLVTGLSQHILLKPNLANLSNSLLITTDHRVYHMILKSTNNSSYMVEVKWHYQASPLMFVSNQDQGYAAPGAMPAAGATGGSPFQLDLANLDFNYQFGTVKGSKPSWYPTRVFNDGRQTFIEFPVDFYNSDLPVLYLQTGDKSYGTMFNWRLKGRYMIIDAVVTQARLQAGVSSKNDQTIVQINHT